MREQLEFCQVHKEVELKIYFLNCSSTSVLASLASASSFELHGPLAFFSKLDLSMLSAIALALIWFLVSLMP